MALLHQLNLVTQDMDKAVGFYARLGVDLRVTPDGKHAEGKLDNGMTLELDTTDFVPDWDAGWRGTTGGSTVIGFALESREAVDERYSTLTAAEGGGLRHQPPYDAFWGARYAIVDDPDGNPIGLMSPIEAERKYWPPHAKRRA